MAESWHVEILTTKDHERWCSLVESLPHRDAFFRPEYVIPFEHLSGEAGRLFFFGDTANYIVYPFYLRPVSPLPSSTKA